MARFRRRTYRLPWLRRRLPGSRRLPWCRVQPWSCAVRTGRGARAPSAGRCAWPGHDVEQQVGGGDRPAGYAEHAQLPGQREHRARASTGAVTAAINRSTAQPDSSVDHSAPSRPAGAAAMDCCRFVGWQSRGATLCRWGMPRAYRSCGVSGPSATQAVYGNSSGKDAPMPPGGCSPRTATKWRESHAFGRVQPCI